MLTPYDWQEAIGNRAQYIETKLASGLPVLAVTLQSGILMLTYRRQSRKIFEIYDRLIMGAVGQQSDVEALRVAAVDFAHQEGFSRSEEDVTLQRVVTALSAPIKRAFSDFSYSPNVAQALFAEVGTSPEEDQFAVLEFDGDFGTRTGAAFLAHGEVASAFQERLDGFSWEGKSTESALEELTGLWQSAFTRAGGEIPEGLDREAVLLERAPRGERRLRTL